MIGFLRGKIIEFSADNILLDVSGVGYEVHCSQQVLSSLQELKNTELVFWIYTHVREDALQLFGFLSREEKQLFLSLLKVNGVGPKSALSILGGAPLQQIFNYIESGNAKALSSLPKVGKKTAEQIILSLKGKLVRIEEHKTPEQKNIQEIQSALLNLGFKLTTVEEFIEGLPLEISVEDGIRQGLSALHRVK